MHEFKCYDVIIDDDYYYEEEGTEIFDHIYDEIGKFSFEDIKESVSVKIKADYEECFNRTDFLEEICKADDTQYKDFNSVMNDSDYAFYLYASYDIEKSEFVLRMVEDYIGDKPVALNESEKQALNKTINDYMNGLIDRYNAEKSKSKPVKDRTDD